MFDLVIFDSREYAPLENALANIAGDIFWADIGYEYLQPERVIVARYQYEGPAEGKFSRNYCLTLLSEDILFGNYKIRMRQSGWGRYDFEIDESKILKVNLVGNRNGTSKRI